MRNVIGDARLETAFKLLERAAIAGERCPKSAGDGAPKALASVIISALARAGRIRVEIYAKNFRRVTILTGEHAGKSTADAPDPKWRPYKIIEQTEGDAP